MARKCSSPGCAFSLPDKYPLSKCPWHLAPGKGPVKIAAAITIAAAGFGGGIAYKKFRAYLRDKDARKQREARQKKAASKPEEQEVTSSAGKSSTTKSKKPPRTRKKSATKRKTVKAATT
jgi:heme exporter protein D